MSEETITSEQQETNNEKEKICFVIMPISETDAYGPGHFKRVYEYIIKPACYKVGFTPIRADDVQQTNVIVIDILKKILESDMVICDLSSKNPNVFYELGIRQAFGLPAVLIKDQLTGRVFDISSLRDFEYDQNLRVDTVNEAVETISELLTNTYRSYQSGSNEINSLISLLNIPAAKKPQEMTLTDDTRIILESIETIGKRISRVEDKVKQQKNGGLGISSYVTNNPVPIVPTDLEYIENENIFRNLTDPIKVESVREYDIPATFKVSKNTKPE